MSDEPAEKKLVKVRVMPLSRPVAVMVGIVFAAAVLLGARFVLLKNDAVHYHANFALYVNGKQDMFSGPGYYQEVEVCGQGSHPEMLAHMHDNNNHLIHIHAANITWSQFLTNLGYSLGDKVVATESGVYENGKDGNKLTFILNGKPVDAAANLVVGDLDTLLISYGKEDQATMQKHYDAIERDAHTADITKDPAACQGEEALTLGNRFKRTIKFWQ